MTQPECPGCGKELTRLPFANGYFCSPCKRNFDPDMRVLVWVPDPVTGMRYAEVRPLYRAQNTQRVKVGW